MNLILELLQDYRALDDQNSEQPQEELTADDQLNQDDSNDPIGQLADDAMSDDQGDPNKQGLIRTVKGAHLVYKRKQEDGTFDELWVYSASDMRGEQEVRRAILSGTDIPVDGMGSEDGQTYSIWSAGNAEVMQITGLPS